MSQPSFYKCRLKSLNGSTLKYKKQLGGNSDSENIVKAVEEGYLLKEDLDRANYRRLLSLFKVGRVDNSYLDPDYADKVREENFEGAKKAAYVFI